MHADIYSNQIFEFNSIFFKVVEAEIGVERVENKFYVKSKYLDNENVHRTSSLLTCSLIKFNKKDKVS